MFKGQLKLTAMSPRIHDYKQKMESEARSHFTIAVKVLRSKPQALHVSGSWLFLSVYMHVIDSFPVHTTCSNDVQIQYAIINQSIDQSIIKWLCLLVS